MKRFVLPIYIQKTTLVTDINSWVITGDLTKVSM